MSFEIAEKVLAIDEARPHPTQERPTIFSIKDVLHRHGQHGTTIEPYKKELNGGEPLFSLLPLYFLADPAPAPTRSETLILTLTLLTSLGFTVLTYFLIFITSGPRRVL
jgi:hypothetical protein